MHKWTSNKANARLIAAAPELLEALKMLRDAIYDTDFSDSGSVREINNALVFVKKAIAKAEGKEEK